MRAMKHLLTCLLILVTCICVLALVGCDELLNKEELHEHTLVKHEGQTPTCTQDGWTPYETCADCNEYTTYKALLPLGHDYTDEYVPNGDVHSRFCERCSKTIDEEHDWEKSGLYDAPTCTDEGLQSYECSTCGARKSETLSVIEHNYSGVCTPNGDVHSVYCVDCTNKIDEPHEWQAGEITKEPTCAKMGIQTYFCVLCGTETERDVPRTDNHVEGEWVTTVLETALTDGEKILECKVCGITLKTQTIPSDVKSMPIIYMEGDYTSATAEKNEVNMTVSYIDPNGESFEAWATIKVQGASSVKYDKKNYTIKFYKDDTYDKKLKVDLGWGKESKYVMKANWVDYTQARNIVSCRLWKDMVSSRPDSVTKERLVSLTTNAGAIDGYPIAVYMNGEFYGLYTMNVPKDEWMFGMDDSETEAFIGAEDWLNTDFSVLLDGFVENSQGDLVSNGGGWELKYCGTDDTTWVTDSFNRLISFCQNCYNNGGDGFKEGISQYMDVDAAIDYLIYFYAICMRDNTCKNMLWATYDGQVWIPSVYDQDGTFGQAWDGIRYADAKNELLPLITEDGRVDVNCQLGSKKFILWDLMLNTFTEEILLRYNELRATVLSEENIITEFEAFRALIPASVYDADCAKWKSSREIWWQSALKYGEGMVPETYKELGYDYMYSWIRDRLAALDEAMGNIRNNPK